MAFRHERTVRTTVRDTVHESGRWAETLLGGLRLALGSVFLWAFLDKTFGLGFATPPERAWVAGGSPTTGWLLNATHGPFAPAFQALAGNVVVDALFMLGLLGVGVALVLGIGLYAAGAAGATLMALMWLAALPPETNPLVDDHVVYAGLLLLLPWLQAGRHLGLGAWWARRPIVRRYAWLE